MKIRIIFVEGNLINSREEREMFLISLSLQKKLSNLTQFIEQTLKNIFHS